MTHSFHKYCCSFDFISLEQNLQETYSLDPNTATQATDVWICINKTNKQLAVFYIYDNFNNALSSSVFLFFVNM